MSDSVLQHRVHKMSVVYVSTENFMLPDQPFPFGENSRDIIEKTEISLKFFDLQRGFCRIKPKSIDIYWASSNGCELNQILGNQANFMSTITQFGQ